MQNWLKRSLLVLAVFGVCWIGAVWYWRSTTRIPDTGDLALAMLVMPLVLLSTVWLASKSLSARATDIPAPVAAPELTGQNAAAHGAAPSAARAPWQPLGIAAAALRMPHGDSPAALGAAIAQGEARLDLDPELTDMQGFPIMAGRVADIDTEPVAEWLAEQHSGSVRVKPHQLRALALGGAVAAELSMQADAHDGDSVLQLQPLLPDEWSAPMREVATNWLVRCAVDAGWPAERLSLRQPSHDAPAVSLPVALRDLAAQSGTARAPAYCMLLACDSAIDADAVEQMAVNGKLFGPRNQNGRMPAEGAAGILLQPAATSREILRLLALAHGAPDQPAPPLSDLAQEALVHGREMAIDYVAADTDHRVAAVADLMQCVEARVPALDTDSALACVGSACGYTGAAGALAALALAHQQAADTGGHALCLANADRRQPFALLVGPDPTPAPSPASSAPILS